MSSLTRVAERYARWTLTRDQIPPTAGFYVSMVARFWAVVALSIAPIVSDSFSVELVARWGLGLFAGAGILSPLRGRLAYDRGYRHGRAHADR